MIENRPTTSTYSCYTAIGRGHRKLKTKQHPPQKKARCEGRTQRTSWEGVLVVVIPSPEGLGTQLTLRISSRPPSDASRLQSVCM